MYESSLVPYTQKNFTKNMNFSFDTSLKQPAQTHIYIDT